MVFLGKTQELDESLSFCMYSCIEFCNLAGAGYMISKTSLILEDVEDNHSNKACDMGILETAYVECTPNT